MNIPYEEQRKQEVAPMERRRFPRFSKQICLTLYVGERDSKPARINTFRVRTIDVSRGGLRIESPREVGTGSRVGFESDDDAMHSISGVGEVVWCNPKGIGDNCEFGISFPVAIQPRE